MAHFPGTSGNTQIFNPSAHLADLPIFQEVLYFERKRDNPVYAVYADPQSTIYLSLLDWHIERLKINFQGPYPGFNFPHIETILDMVEERKRYLLLEDTLVKADRRLDLTYVLKGRSNLLIGFLHQLRLIKAMLNKLHLEHDNIINDLLAQYYNAYVALTSQNTRLLFKKP